MKSSFLVILGLICIAHCATLNEVSCQTATSTATYNLNPLKLPLGKYYTVKDFRTVEEPPQETEISGRCNVTGPVGDSREGPAPSFFENVTSHQCFHAASQIDKVKPSNSILFQSADPMNPASGIKLLLIGGEVYGNSNFQTHITVNCIGERKSADVPKEGIIFLEDGYKVELTIESPYGCPNECVSSGSLCSSHGICSYDVNNKNSHCYCNDGYTGTYCDKKNVFSWFNMTILFVVLVVLLAVIILGFAMYIIIILYYFRFVMYNKLRRIDAKMNIDALNSLEKQFNQLGQLA